MSVTTGNNKYLIYMTILGLTVASEPLKLNNIVFLDSFQYTCETKTEFAFLDEDSLTKMGMSISEKSLAKDWENERDEHWLSFIKD